jgi:beta-N-acetylhexosaminidase
MPEVSARGVRSVADVQAVVELARGRSLVAVVRDPMRHEWQAALLAAAVAHPAAVIVDVGWPVELPAELPAIRTRGVAPGLLAAAADALAGP